MSAAKHFFPIFHAMKWTFIKATDSYKFLTSDNPIFYWDPTHDSKSFPGVGLLNKNIELTFPLTKDLALLSSWIGEVGYVKADNQMVKVINRRTVMSALRFVFASEKSNVLNKFVRKYINSGPKLVVG